MAKSQRKKKVSTSQNSEGSSAGKTNQSKELNHPHDKWFKASFGMITVIRGYLTDVFPKKYGEKLDLDSLERVTDSYISKELEETYSDLVWRCWLKTGRTIMISFLFEHKSYKPKRPHLQLGQYQFGAYHIQDQTNPNAPLIQVIPILVYHGQENWAFVEPFEMYFGEIDPDFMCFMPSFDFILTDIQSYPDDVIKAFEVRFLEKIFLGFKYYRDKDFLKNHFAELWLLHYNSYETDETTFFIHAFGVYLSAIAGKMPIDEVHKQLNKNPEDMVLTERFLAQYKNKGLKEGRQEERETLILNIYQKKGWSASQIADITDFDTAYIQSVIDKFEKKDN